MEKTIKNVYSLNAMSFSEKSISVDMGCSDGHYILPAFVDVHTHGIGGYEFEDADVDGILKMLELYAKAGTVYVMPTLGTVSLEKLLQATDNILNAAKLTNGSNKHARILGIHYECRYLNPVKAGAHDKSLLAGPNIAEADLFIEKIKRASEELGRQLHFHFTIAPELDGGLEFIRHITERGGTVGMGHTDADSVEAISAIEAGAVSFTHLFNAMRPLTHRQSSALSIALAGNTYTELICDGKHLIPETVRLIAAVKSSEKTVLVSDSVGAIIPEGESFEFLGHTATITDGVALQSDGTIAGSVITMAEALKNYIDYTGMPPAYAVNSVFANPLKMIKADDVLTAQSRELTDFVALDKSFKLVGVFINQKKVM